MSRWMAVGVMAFVVCACATEDDAMRDFEARDVGGVVMLAGDNGEIVDTDSDSVCSCPTTTCEQQWVLDNIGCDVCVHVLCSDDAPISLGDYRSTCVRCQDLGRALADTQRLH